ncbi:hypothetical protein BH18ACT8_BH18ACT8_12620 [soil metagenome]
MNVGLPSWIPIASLVVVCVAIVSFFVTGGLGGGNTSRTVSDPGISRGDGEPDKNRNGGGTASHGKKRPGDSASKPADKRRKQPKSAAPAAYVEVYNNSTVSGLAAQTAAELQDAGWQVVGTDNWYGNIPATTVYFPDRLQEQAELLARDLGIARVLPAVSPMRFDRLTVILTAAA